MMTPQFDYPASGKWAKGFAAHDLGAYPVATGQTYGGDMPLEESADMIILSMMLQKITGNSDYSEKYWDLLTTWTDYLVENGRTPTNQLCTDDFMGPSEKNANLSLKSTLGVYAYAELARLLGKDEVAATYETKADAMAKYWRSYAMTHTSPIHSRLAMSGGNNTWSEKYNMVWDMMLGWNHFKDARLADMEYYQTKMLKYGLPLDSRGEYNKNDWHFWVGAMSKDAEEFQTYVDPMYLYINETPTRVPLSDYHDANTGERRGYMARPVVAGYWMKVLMDKFLAGELTDDIKCGPLSENVMSTTYYDIEGRRVQHPVHGLYIERNIMDDNTVVTNKKLKK